ncbi:MAG: signal peptide peptidase SppA, partial [Succinivibrio sp.]
VSGLDPDMPVRFGMDEIEKALSAATRDDDVKAVVADVGDLEIASLEDIQRITKACDDFRSSTKKPLIFFGRNFSQAQYLLSSHAGEIVLDPLGEIDLHGFAATPLYFKQALDKFGLTAYVFRRGSHKSAVEPLMRDSMSPEVKAEYQDLLDSMMEMAQKTVAAARPAFKEKKILPDAPEFLDRLEKAGGDEARLALEYGLVDTLETRDGLASRLAKDFPSKDDSSEPDSMGIDDMLAIEDSRAPSIESSSELAVIAASGTITSFSREERAFTPDNIQSALDDASSDDKVKGVLLRINSGGGEMGASEDIRRSIEKFKKDGRKVVVYMEDMAASGAYMAASAADKIVASPWALTGSIGVFATALSPHEFLNRNGVSSSGVSTSPFAEESMAAALNDETIRRIDLGIGHAYDVFVGMVAKSRGVKASDAPRFAEGKVFTASEAQKLGLVDEVGDMKSAIRLLEKECGLKEDEATVVDFPMPSSNGLGALSSLLLRGASAALPAPWALEVARAIAAGLPNSTSVKAPIKRPLVMAQEPLMLDWK